MQDDQTTQPSDEQTQPDETQVPSELEQLQAELDAEKTARIQLMADFANFRKYMELEKAKFGAMANTLLIHQILDVIDDVQLAKADPELQAERMQQVMQIFTDKLVGSLNSVGVDMVESKAGDKFDPQTMEAITTIPAESEDQDNTIAQVVSSAFKFRQEGNLLKSAKVVVYKFKA